MNVLIIEDEPHAGKRLKRVGKDVMPGAFFHGPVESIVEAVEWLKENPAPDLLLVDIHLADGLSFEIFSQVEVKAPVIFTTAYDQYAIRAFKFNSIDYLLKPVESEALATAYQKFKDSGFNHPQAQLGSDWPNQLALDVQHAFKKRFVLKVGDKLRTVDTVDVNYAYSENKATYLVDTQGKSHLTDYTLDQLEELFNPSEFFRLNRKYISRYAVMVNILSYSNSRLRVEIEGCHDQDIVLSRDKAKAFKIWLDS